MGLSRSIIMGLIFECRPSIVSAAMERFTGVPTRYAAAVEAVEHQLKLDRRLLTDRQLIDSAITRWWPHLTLDRKRTHRRRRRERSSPDVRHD